MVRIISIITLFYPNKEHYNNIQKIAKQSKLVFLCDNSPVSNVELFSDIDNMKYYWDGENKGLSKGFNNVLCDSRLEWNSGDYVVFFDQDTIIPPNHIQLLIEEYEKIKKRGVNIGCIGPMFSNFNSHDKVSISVKNILTSSMLCEYGNLESVNFWNEELFLDLADWDLCWRFKNNGLKVYLTNATTIIHFLGLGEKKVGIFTLKIGRPFREYYQTRDCLRLINKKYVPWEYKIRFLLMILVRPLLHILFLDDKQKRLAFIIKGIMDYGKGIKGALKSIS